MAGYKVFLRKRWWLGFAAAIVVLGLVLAAGSRHYRLSPAELMQKAGKVGAVHVLSLVYIEDRQEAEELRAEYWVGPSDNPLERKSRQSWRDAFAEDSSSRVEQIDFPVKQRVPFVYEELSEPYLSTLREEFDLQGRVHGSFSEYQAMLELGGWLGTRWDHGTDPVPGGSKEGLRPARVIQSGQQGRKYTCEIAAIVTVQAFSAMGWPARLVSASGNGYDLHHGVAEIWSNQFNKWFVLDTDFNVVFEAHGVPLSAYELCHKGPELREKGALEVRRFAPAKPSLPYRNLLPYFEYIHVDLRNDWHSRNLRRGSPAGGDLATWWTARDDLGPVLTAKERVEDKKVFNWKVNSTWISLDQARKRQNSYELRLELSGYSPYFKHFLLRVDQGHWEKINGFSTSLQLKPGEHRIQARLVTTEGHRGPVSSVDLIVGKDQGEGNQTP